MRRLAAVVAALSFACNAGQGSPREPTTAPTTAPSLSAGSPVASSTAASTAPPIAAPIARPSAVAVTGVDGGVDLGELVATASRKMMHDDGAGCLADLDRVAAIDPKLGARLALNRGQCEMLIGHCQAGKRRIAAYYVDEMNVTKPRAETMAESLVAMRCRGGDSTPRDELLRAIFELSDAAFVNTRDPAYCGARVATIQRLSPVVTPLGPDDTQVVGAPKALFHTAASCFARAGDCRSARAVYEANYPKEALARVNDAAERAKIVDAAFAAGIEACKGAN